MPVPRDHLTPSLEKVYDHIDNIEASTQQGSDVDLTAGTDETPRTWSAKQIAEYVDSIVNQ